MRLFFPGSVCRRSADTRSPALLLIFSRGKANDPNMTSGLPDVVPTQSGSIRPQLLCGSLYSETRGASAPSSLPTGAGVTQCRNQGCSPTASAQPVTGRPPPAVTAGTLQKEPIDPVTPRARATRLSLSAVPLSPPWAQGGPRAFQSVDDPRVPMANRWEAGQPLPPPAWSPPLSWAWMRSDNLGLCKCWPREAARSPQSRCARDSTE